MLRIHRSARSDRLAEELGRMLAGPAADPFTPEVVAVPTRGVERWLAQQLSLGLGVCANVGFPSLRTLVRDAVAVASEIDPESDPWVPERAVWPLRGVIDASLGEPWLDVLAAHLGTDATSERRARRFTTARHLAQLFD